MNQGGANGSLPRPSHPERWQPLRSGILNLYRYSRQEFWYEQGHLLLRGNNGTGKSRVLALQLPFLLDGETSSHRVEPDADPAKRMEWNVLMDVHERRTGYTWIEFGRGDETGDRFLTLGCGLQAAKGSDLKKWFFVTRQRIGEELFLETPAGTPLTQDALRDALGEHGTLYRKVKDYRRAVDDALFQLGEDRYGALVDLLIQLRQPQLSRQLDERRLSEALSNSLPPLPSNVLHEVAESFRSLEDDRQALANDEAAVTAVAAFRKTYRRYARATAGCYSERLRATHSRYERAQGEIREKEKALREAERTREASRALAAERHIELTEARAEVEALRASPEMKTADRLDRLDRDTRESGQRLDGARTQVATLAEQHERQVEVAHQARVCADQQSKQADSARAAALEAAGEIGVQADLRTILDQAESHEQARVAATAAAQRLGNGLRHLRDMRRGVRVAESEEHRARDRAQQQRERLDRAREEETSCRRSREAAVAEYLGAATAWGEGLNELTIPELDDALERSVAWCEALQSPPPLEDAAQRAYEDAARALERRRLSVDTEREAIRGLDAELAEEAGALAEGSDRAPPPPYTRGGDARTGKPGAPLWRLCDFRDHVPPEDRAGIEAALEAAGLLDAWVAPDGSLRKHGDGDALVTPSAELCDPTCALPKLLRVDIDPADAATAALDVTLVEGILARIAVVDGEHHTFVTTDGRWKHNLLRGRWSKPAAEFIGAAAREQARRRRLAEIEAERGMLAAEDARYARELELLSVRGTRLRAERQGCPDSQPILTADQDSRRAEAVAAREREDLLELTDAHDTARQRLDTLRAKYRKTAEDLHLEQWTDDLDALAEAIQNLNVALGALWIESERAQAEQRNVERTAAELERAEIRLADARAACETAETDHARRQREYKILRDTVGESVKAIKARLDAAMRRVDDAEHRLEDARAREMATREIHARCEERRRMAEEQLREADDERAVQHRAFRQFVATRVVEETDLPFDAPPSPEQADTLAVNPAVEFAREIDRRLPSETRYDDEAYDRIKNELQRRFQELLTALTAHHHSPLSEIHHGITVVTCPYQGRNRSMSELGRCLQGEVTQRKTLLAAKEREFIENFLIGEVAHHLHHQIVAADLLVADMNAELDAHPMSTGMRLRFVWAPRDDGPAGLHEVRRLLAQTQEVLSPDDRHMLAGFLQQRIREVREAEEAMGWRESLEQAVDYRRWHIFGVERRQAERWVRLTRRTHGTGSGGEKAIALTIPQFAAAAAHYHNIPHAPRLIMLDEAFVGIDSDMRGKCMDLLHQFDLDFVMTSEREWGCYPSTRGLAIYQLATHPGVDAIGVTRWVWNGKEKLQRNTPPCARPASVSCDAAKTAGQSEFCIGDST